MQIRAKLKLNEDDFLCQGEEPFLCMDELQSWISLPDSAKRIELVASTRSHPTAYELSVDKDEEDYLEVIVDRGKYPSPATTCNLDAWVQAANDKGCRWFWIEYE